MKRNSNLIILHLPPPIHGASMVGDFIFKNKQINKKLNNHFVKISMTDNVEGLMSFKWSKVIKSIALFARVIGLILFKRPRVIYFTPSYKGFAFYRDLILRQILIFFKYLMGFQIYFHFHTSGIPNYKNNKLHSRLLNYFLKKVHLILLDPALEKSFKTYPNVEKIFYLPNSVKDPFSSEDFDKYLHEKFELRNFKKPINVLYLSNLIKSKGYRHLLRLATKFRSINFHFAGAFGADDERLFFFNYVRDKKLNNVFYHGLLRGEEKHNLFKESDIFALPTRYEYEAFPLCILEALSYGIPVISTDQGAISSIIDENVGIALSDPDEIDKSLTFLIEKYISKEASKKCRDKYLKEFSTHKFEKSFIEILQNA